VVVLKELKDMQYHEIAEVLNLSWASAMIVPSFNSLSEFLA
jgi:DNA-directed RNA polymerase specialized sigma24 family protein